MLRIKLGNLGSVMEDVELGIKDEFGNLATSACDQTGLWLVNIEDGGLVDTGE